LPEAEAVSQSIKDWAAAQPRFARLLKAGMSADQALSRWGLDLLQANQISEATVAFLAALALAPADPLLWANCGLALARADSPAESAACLEYSVTLLPQQPSAWLMLGMARKKLGDLPRAERAYRAALQQKPNWGAALQLLAILKEEQKDFAGASECLEACVQAGGADAAVLANLGKLHHQTGRFADSCQAYVSASGLDPANAHYRQMARKTTFLRDVLQGLTTEAAIAHYQKSFATGENPSETDLMELLQGAFSVLSGFGHTEAALRVGRKKIELWPPNPSLTYLMSAVAGDQTIDRSPPEYVVEHFDSFAQGFDAQLVGALGYDAPEKICAAVRARTAPGHLYAALDAGCGTGLCGPLLRPISRTLTGVDLSPKMLEQAAKKGTYDALFCEELTAFLRRSEGHFDLMVAADLTIYFGDLAPLFAAAGTALQPGGLLAFSTELGAGESYRLLPSGRFAHAAEYVRSIVGPAFVEICAEDTTIRLDGTRRLPGNIFIFRRA
jgi:predicted TPR repeat methyltransferase